MVGQPLADTETQSWFWRADGLLPLTGRWTVEGGTRVEAMDTAETLRNYQTSSSTSVRLRFERSTSATPTTATGWGQITWRNENGGFSAGARVSNRTGDGWVAQPWVVSEITARKLVVRGGIGQSAQYIDPLISTLTPQGMSPETATSYDVSAEHPVGGGFRLQGAVFYRTENHVLRRSGEEHVDPITGVRVPETIFPVFTNSLEGSSHGMELVLTVT